MKIYGIGSDIISNNRIKKSIKNKYFLKRIFTKKEIQIGLKKNNNHYFYAKRFAAKEAFSKALGTGIANGIQFNEIIVLNEKNGKPFIKLINKTKTIVERKLRNKKYKISLSLSDEKVYAVAFVTISI